MARTRAAKPAAEEARPAAVGKLFSDTILSGRDERFGKVGSRDSSSFRRERRERRQACVRAPEMSWGLPFRVRVSFWKAGLQEAVVWVRRSSCERVTEREELVGRLRAVSRLPQYLTSISDQYRKKLCRCELVAYLMTAMFTGA